MLSIKHYNYFINVSVFYNTNKAFKKQKMLHSNICYFLKSLFTKYFKKLTQSKIGKKFNDFFHRNYESIG